MGSSPHTKRITLIITSLLVFGVFASIVLPVNKVLADTRLATDADRKQPLVANAGSAVYLPVLFRDSAYVSPFGIHMYNLVPGTGFDKAIAAGTYWSRSGEVAWSEIQPDEGVPPDWEAWEATSNSDEMWILASQNNLTDIVIVDSTPLWAQRQLPDNFYYGWYCGPVSEEKLDDFAAFMYELVSRYSQPPYNIKYWELWNEPDIAPSLVYPDSPIGCWGDYSDKFGYGGGYYAEMLKVVYPEIKRADPTAKVLVGGLLLDCDPRIDNACKNGSHKDLPPRFLEGILANEGGDYFDGISFHAYDGYQDSLGEYGTTNWDSSWDSTGPVLIAKSNYIKSLLAKYGVTGKLLLNTENAIHCNPCALDNTFQLTKAYYVAQTFAAAIREGLTTNLWFSLYGWHSSGLLKPDNTEWPAYRAYSFASSMLYGAKFEGDIPGDPGVRAYKFRNTPRLIWLLWSLDGDNHNITLPSTPTAGYHVDGTPLGTDILSGVSLKVTLEPVYIEWGP